MEEKIKLLMETAGCNRYEAELAYKSAGGDFVEALDFLNRVSARLAITRGKFMAAEKFIYGVFLIIADVRKKSILTASAVATKNPSVYETDVLRPWEDIEKTIYAARLGAGALPELSGILQEKILSAALESADLSPAAEAVEAMLSAALESADVSVTLDTTEEPYKTPVVPVADEFGSSSAPRPRSGGVTLCVEPLTDEKDGARASTLSRGDVVWIRVNDEREIAQYLAERLGAAKGGRVFPLASEIVSVDKDKDNGAVALGFRFAENVAGLGRVDSSTMVKKAERSDSAGRLAEWWRKLFG